MAKHNNPRPNPPKVVGVGIYIKDSKTKEGVAFALVNLDTFQGQANKDGYISFGPIVANKTYSLTIQASNYSPYSQPLNVLDQTQDYHFTLDSTIKEPEVKVLKRVIVKNENFAHEDGELFRWQGYTGFLLYALDLAGVDINPIIDDYLSTGGNLIRVTGMADGFAEWPEVLRDQHFWPSRIGERFYTNLRPFADKLAIKGCYLEFTVFADALIIMPSRADRINHILKIRDSFKDHSSVFVEVANEPGHENQINEQEAHELGLMIQDSGFLVCSGNYNVPEDAEDYFHLDYFNTHTERKPEWPRTGRSLNELKKGFDWKNGKSFNGVHCAVVADEPTGADENSRGDSRSNIPEDFRWFAATCALFGDGATFHSSDGILTQKFRNVTRQCAIEFFKGLNFPPLRAQNSPYQRGGFGGGSGVGNMPIEHHDLDESQEPKALRTFCKEVDNEEYCVRLRPVGNTVTRDNWNIIEEPEKGLVKLGR